MPTYELERDGQSQTFTSEKPLSDDQLMQASKLLFGLPKKATVNSSQQGATAVTNASTFGLGGSDSPIKPAAPKPTPAASMLGAANASGSIPQAPAPVSPLKRPSVATPAQKMLGAVKPDPAQQLQRLQTSNVQPGNPDDRGVFFGGGSGDPGVDVTRAAQILGKILSIPAQAGRNVMEETQPRREAIAKTLEPVTKEVVRTGRGLGFRSPQEIIGEPYYTPQQQADYVGKLLPEGSPAQGVTKGLVKAGAGFLTPQNVAILAGSGGASAVPYISDLAAAGFLLDLGPKGLEELGKGVERGDWEQITGGLVTSIVGGLAGVHAFNGGNRVAARWRNAYDGTPVELGLQKTEGGAVTVEIPKIGPNPAYKVTIAASEIPDFLKKNGVVPPEQPGKPATPLAGMPRTDATEAVQPSKPVPGVTTRPTVSSPKSDAITEPKGVSNEQTQIATAPAPKTVEQPETGSAPATRPPAAEVQTRTEAVAKTKAEVIPEPPKKPDFKNVPPIETPEASSTTVDSSAKPDKPTGGDAVTDSSRARIRDINAALEDKGLDKTPGQPTESWDAVRARVSDPEVFDKIVKSLKNYDPAKVADITTDEFVVGSAHLREVGRQLSEAIKADDQGAIDAKTLEFQHISNVLSRSSTEAGRNLAIRGSFVVDPTDVGTVLHAAEKMTDGKLSPAARRTLATASEKAAATKKAVDAAIGRRAKAAEVQVTEGSTERLVRSAQRQTRIESIRTRRKDLGNELRTKLGLPTVGAGPGPFAAEILPTLGKYLMTYAEEGSVTLAELVDKARSDFPGAAFTERQVYDAISGRGKTPNTGTLSQTRSQLADLKREARLLSMREDELAGIDTRSKANPNAPKTSPRLAKLEEQIAALRKGRDLDAAIAKLQDELRTGNLTEGGKKVSPQKSAKEQQLADLRKEKTDLLRKRRQAADAPAKEAQAKARQTEAAAKREQAKTDALTALVEQERKGVDTRKAKSSPTGADTPAQAEIRKEINSIREARDTQKKIDALTKQLQTGNFPTVNSRPNPAKTALQEQLAGLQKQKAAAIAEAGRLKKLALEQQGVDTRTQAPAKPPTAAQEALTKQRTLNAVNKEIAALEEAIRKGDFAPDKPVATRKVDPDVQAVRDKRSVLESRTAAEKVLNALGKPPKTRVTKPILDIAEHEYAQGAQDLDTFAKAIKKKYGNALPDSVLQEAFKKGAEAYRKDSADLENIKNDMAETIFKDVERTKPWMQKAAEFPGRAINASRAVLTSLDLSAFGRQGLILGANNLSRPLELADSVAKSVKAFASEEVANAVEADIRTRPNALKPSKTEESVYERAGLHLSERGSKGLQMQEEAFRSKDAEKIPLGVGKVVKASERAYTTYLNKLRADNFDALLSGIEKNGVKATDKELQAIGNFVNAASGRGALPQKIASAADALSGVIFAPRFVASRFQMLSGEPIGRGFAASPRTGVAIARTYLKAAGGIGVIYGMLQAAGGKVDNDPRSPNFGKVQFGNHVVVDPTAGLSQAAVFSYREIMQTTKSVTGKVTKLGEGAYKPENQITIGQNYVRSKLSPFAGSVYSLLDKEGGVPRDYLGNKTSVGKEAVRNVIPMSINDVREAAQAEGMPLKSALSVMAILGFGVTQQTPRPATGGSSIVKLPNPAADVMRSLPKVGR